MKLIFSLILSLVSMTTIAGDFDKFNRDNTVSGPDLNGNGVRDDIDVFIAGQRYTPAQTQSMYQAAQALANILRANPADQNALRVTDLALQKSINCAFAQFPASGLVQPHVVIKNIEKMTANTKMRSDIYSKYQIAMNGRVLASPQGDSCELPN